MPNASSRTDRILSVAAVITALAAVTVSIYQAYLYHDQQRASAWPYLMQANTFLPDMPYTRVVENAGVGPALVRSFRVLVDGEPYRQWNDAVRALAGESEPGLIYSSFGRGSVLPAGATRELLTLPEGPRALRFWQAAQTRLNAIVCYCSVYDECWVGNSSAEEPEAVEECPHDPDTEFQN